MKKIKFLITLLACLCITFTGCSGDSGGGGSTNVDEVPGTVGKASDPLIAASNLLSEVDPENNKTVLFYYRADKSYSDWALWLWENGGDGSLAFPSTFGKFEIKDSVVDGKIYSIGCMVLDPNMFAISAPAVKEVIESKSDINFIIRKTDSWTKDTDDVKYNLGGNTHFMIVSGDKDVYPVSEVMTPFISNAMMETLSTMKVNLSVKYALEGFASDNGFMLKATDGTKIDIIDVVNYSNQNNRSRNFTNTLLVTLSKPLDVDKNWAISHSAFEPAEGRNVSAQNAIKISLQDFKYSGNDLGLTINGSSATFKLWAPLASDVKILFYNNVSDVGNFKPETVAAKSIGSTTEATLKGTPSSEVSMVLDRDTGIWTYTLSSIGSNRYYKYKIINNGITYYVSDIYAKACSADSIASQIVDINESGNYGTKANYVNPFGANGSVSKDNTDAVIYEMHIRDWSRAISTTSTGKFNEMCSDEIIDHLKDLGVTHVQILPMFDYAQVNSDLGYNWGYNPYHYNVPEGRYTDYSTNPDGTAAVEQMRYMVKKFHDNGISVIMDVVYNHTSGTQGGSLYDSTVPYYYYRIKDDGTYANGSGCGNETDSEAPMFRKYMVDTLKHWMLDYHINGFRFDLMGCHSKEAMAEIYKELSAIDQNVMVYGEPWTGGDSLVKNTADSAVVSEGYGVGAFDDDFRDAIKGAEFGGFNAGHIQGEFNDDGIAAGLVGKSGKNTRNTTGKPGLALHYIECHDNFTLYDKLVYSLAENITDTKAADKEGKIATVWPTEVTAVQKELIKKEAVLGGAFVLLSQGTPFLNGGQEFLRTKKGDPDSYAADTKGGVKWTNTDDADDDIDTNIDEVNSIDLNLKTINVEVYNFYKGLIALRKEYSDAFGKNADALASKAKVIVGTKSSKIKGVTKYTTGTFCVFFNATDEEIILDNSEISGYSKVVDVSSGTPTESTSVPSTVSAKSFVILKK